MDLSHHFLIAMPEMADPMFAGSVTYILQHDSEGAMGLIINRPLSLNLGDVFKSADVKETNGIADLKPTYHGGPVSSEQGFILHRRNERQWEGTIDNDHLCITTSRDLLQAIAIDEGPTDYIFCLGYSGWSAGQLEEELKQNSWLTVEANSDIVFGDDEEGKYQKALSQLGVDLSNLSGHGGLA
jgi:putative transcriptional regulator